MRLTEKLSLLLILAAFALGIALYPRLPAEIASHWNTAGEVDDYLPQFWGTFLLPLIMTGIFILYKLMFIADPKRKNLTTSGVHLRHFVLALLLFFFYLYCLVLAFNLGYSFSIIQWIIPAVSMLFIAIGQVLKEIKPNWTLGIRTPWTLTNDDIWTDTHMLGSKLFKVASMLLLIGVFVPSYSRWLFIGTILLVAVVPIVYSYWRYLQLNKS